MGTPEENKQIVQEGLNKRKAKRKNAQIEAEQEAITSQMIDIVNKNAKAAEVQREIRMAERRTNKKIAKLKKEANDATACMWLSVALFAVSTICYAFGLTELWTMIVSVVLELALFGFNIFILAQNAKALAAVL